MKMAVLLVEAPRSVRTFKTLVNLYQSIQRYNPEHSQLQVSAAFTGNLTTNKTRALADFAI
jgi:hypothetical protein